VVSIVGRKVKFPLQYSSGGKNMVDENTSEISSGNKAELPSKEIEAFSTVTKADDGIGMTAADKAPSATTDGVKFREVHDTPHPHFRWHAEVLVDGHDVYEGMVKDISMQGLNLILDHNLQNSKLIKLHVHVPQPSSSSPHHVLEISGKITSAVYDSTEESFRSHVVFSEFTSESDRAYLQSLLA
jgi:hypothetical protein